jgi:hypothetical protein
LKTSTISLCSAGFSREFYFRFCQGKGLEDIVPTQFETLHGWWHSRTNRQPIAERKKVVVVAIAGISRIWLERNARTFDRQSSTMAQMVTMANEECNMWKKASSSRRIAGRKE